MSESKAGCPSEYTVEIADTICQRIASGESLRRITIDADMPGQSTVYQWLLKDAGFAEKYARARELQADTLADETLDIADNGSNDWMLVNDPDNEAYRVNGEHIQRSRLRIDQRKWFAGKVAPKKYGDKVQIGGDPESPLNIVTRIERVIVDGPNAADRDSAGLSASADPEPL